MITPALLRSWGACWSDSQIAAKFGRRRVLSPREVATDGTISGSDRLWVLCRLIVHLDESAARLFAIESAATVAHLAGDEDDQAQYLGLLNWLCEIEDLPANQRDAAWAAAWAAARAADRAADRAAAWAAAWDAALAADWAAAWAAAWDAALQDAIGRALVWLGDYADSKEAA